MPLFLTIFEGPTHANARPVVVTDDAEVMAAVRSLLIRRLTEGSPGAVVPLRKRSRLFREEKPSLDT